MQVAFRFDRASCVAVGTFNIYIVQPAWLAKREIIPKGIQVAIGSKMDEPGFRFQSPKLKSHWLVAPDRIEIVTRHPDEDCGILMGRVIESLPWTPLKGVGSNVIYKAPADDSAGIAALETFRPPTPAGFTLNQRSLHAGLKRDGHVFNIQLSALDEGLELAVNIHTEIEDRGSEQAQESARKFLDHRMLAESLISEIFGVSVEYVEPDPLPDPVANGVPESGRP
jgi:hypothetical protein